MAFDPRTHASPHVAWKELACHNWQRTAYPVDWRRDRGVALAAELEAVRAACSARAGVDTPLAITSCYRTQEYNAAVHGRPSSQHLEGRAADVQCPFGLTYDAFRDAVLDVAHRPTSRIRFVQFYRHQGFAHLDIRPTAALVVQDYQPPKDSRT